MKNNKILEKLAEFQFKYKYQLLIFIILITFILSFGVPKISVESDINKGMPQQLPIYKLNDKITQEYGGEDIVFLVLQIKDATDKNTIKDIRDPDIINFLVKLEDSLKYESKITQIVSPGTILKNFDHSTHENIVKVETFVPDLKLFYDDEYKTTIFYLIGDVGKEYNTVSNFEQLIKDKINTIGKPGNIDIIISGTPSVSKTIYEMMIHDTIYTLFIASILILLMLFIMEKSFVKSILIFTPLILGIIWTMGTMGFIGLKLSIATVGLGAILLGLGVEYGVFMVTRYYEERSNKLSQLESLKNTVSSIGGAIAGSGSTTVVGFIALTFSMLPMMQNLGLSLALGISFSIIAAIIVAPVLIILEEDLEGYLINIKHEKIILKKERLHKK